MGKKRSAKKGKKSEEEMLSTSVGIQEATAIVIEDEEDASRKVPSEALRMSEGLGIATASLSADEDKRFFGDQNMMLDVSFDKERSRSGSRSGSLSEYSQISDQQVQQSINFTFTLFISDPTISESTSTIVLNLSHFYDFENFCKFKN